MANPQTTQAATPHKQLPKRLIALIALVIIGGMAAAWWFNRPTATKEETDSALQAARTADDNKLDLLEDAYRDAATNEGKARAASQLGTYYSGEGNHKKALDFYKEAEDLTEDEEINLILGIAEAAKHANEREIAKEYYQKAIDYYTNNPDAGTIDTIPRLQEELSSLQTTSNDEVEEGLQ